MDRVAFRLCVAALVLASMVVVLGAFTRLVDAGLGCPDWPTCYGHLWVPLSEEDVSVANERFAHAPVEHDKTWPEQLHRIFASSLGILILALFFFCVRKSGAAPGRLSVYVLLCLLVGATAARIPLGDRLDPWLWVLVVLYFLNLARLSAHARPSDTAPFKLPSFIAGLVVLQGLFGMWTVTLNLWPKVVMLHLLGGFATLSLLWLLLQRLGGWHWRTNASEQLHLLTLKPLATIAIIVVTLQIALGGWLSANYAALACPDFPLCQNSLWPQADFKQGFNFLQDIGPNYLGGLLDSHARIAIHLSHRIGALVVLVVLSFFCLKLWQTVHAGARKLAQIIAVVLLLQLTLGVLNVVLSLPLAVAVAHNAVGVLLLATLITANHRIRTVETSEK